MSPLVVGLSIQTREGRARIFSLISQREGAGEYGFIRASEPLDDQLRELTPNIKVVLTILVTGDHSEKTDVESLRAELEARGYTFFVVNSTKVIDNFADYLALSAESFVEEMLKS